MTLSMALFCSVGMGTARATLVNLIANGGFETGDFTDWTLANSQYTYVTSGGCYDGNYCYFNGEYPAGSTLSQTVDTNVGDMYTLSFWVAESSYGYSPGYQFIVSSSASATPLLTLDDTPDFAYTQFTEEFTAISTTTTISFAGYNLPGGTSMDDVSLVDDTIPAPEPSSWRLIALGGAFVLIAKRGLRGCSSPTLRPAITILTPPSS